MAAGLHPNYLTMLTGPNGSEPVRKLMSELEETLQDRTLDMSHMVEFLGRKALIRVGQLMDNSQNERIILDSAKELMDRSPELQKTQKLQVESFTLDGKDVAALAAALTEAAEVAERHQAARDGLVELTIDNFEASGPSSPLPVQSTPEAVDAEHPTNAVS